MVNIKSRTTGRRLLRHIAAIGLLGLVSACVMMTPLPGSFYEWQRAFLDNQPGHVLRVEPFPKPPEGARAWRVLYRSTGLDGQPIAVSGVVIAPDAPLVSGGKRPVIAWAHPTTGVADNCAPSLLDASYYHRIPGLKTFLDHGYVVVASDYEGLGTPGPHAYLIGESEARSVLDGVRAAGNIEGTGAGTQFAVWGHSQGGHAALFTGQLAASYAPDLELRGVAAAAPATHLSVLLEDDYSTRAGKILTSFALWSWNRVYGASLDDVVDAAERRSLDRIAETCIQTKPELLTVAMREHPLNDEFINGDLVDFEPWKTLLAENSPGNAPAGAPVFIAQGSADTIVTPRVTVDFARRLCANGETVTLDWHDGTGHGPIARRSATEAANWLSERFYKEPPRNDCGRLVQDSPVDLIPAARQP